MADHDIGSITPALDTGPSTAELVDAYETLTALIEHDEATTFTEDRLFRAACRHADVLTQKLVAARHIRGNRPA